MVSVVLRLCAVRF